MSRIRLTILTLVAALAATLFLVVGTASAAACPTGWGSLPKESAPMGTAEIDTVRAGTHPCFDRLVVEVDGPAAGYRAAYVPQVTADGSGAVVPVAGGARIQFVVHHPWFHGPAVGARVVSVSGFPVFRDVRYAGSFEGFTSFGVGVRARLPMRVFTLAGPGGHGRIVLDVARSWR